MTKKTFDNVRTSKVIAKAALGDAIYDFTHCQSDCNFKQLQIAMQEYGVVFYKTQLTY